VFLSYTAFSKCPLFFSSPLPIFILIPTPNPNQHHTPSQLHNIPFSLTKSLQKSLRPFQSVHRKLHTPPTHKVSVTPRRNSVNIDRYHILT
jgi:hypothetical protein